MKLTVLCAGLGRPHAGWAAIDELAVLIARYFDAELLSPAPGKAPWWAGWRRDEREYHQPVQTGGGDVLLVVARGPGDLDLLDSIPDVHRKFPTILAWVTDSYFQAGFGRVTQRYQAITVTAHEDIAPVQQRFGIPVHHVYQGTDALTWAPQPSYPPRARDIDLIAYGRTPPSVHAAFARRLHAADSPYLYLHSPLGHLSGSAVHQERGMLLKLLQRTQVSLAYHLYVEPQGNRPRSMMVTSRWLESLGAGCLVAGKRPVSRMADDMLFWPGATTELADDPEQAVDGLVALLQASPAQELQRRSNIHHVLLHHDWRLRIQQLCQLFHWHQPPALTEDLQTLQARAAAWA